MNKIEAIGLFDMKFHVTIPPSLFGIPELYAVGLGVDNLNGTVPENIVRQNASNKSGKQVLYWNLTFFG